MERHQSILRQEGDLRQPRTSRIQSLLATLPSGHSEPPTNLQGHSTSVHPGVDQQAERPPRLTSHVVEDACRAWATATTPLPDPTTATTTGYATATLSSPRAWRVARRTSSSSCAAWLQQRSPNALQALDIHLDILTPGLPYTVINSPVRLQAGLDAHVPSPHQVARQHIAALILYPLRKPAPGGKRERARARPVPRAPCSRARPCTLDAGDAAGPQRRGGADPTPASASLTPMRPRAHLDELTAPPERRDVLLDRARTARVRCDAVALRRLHEELVPEVLGALAVDVALRDFAPGLDAPLPDAEVADPVRALARLGEALPARAGWVAGGCGAVVVDAALAAWEAARGLEPDGAGGGRARGGRIEAAGEGSRLYEGEEAESSLDSDEDSDSDVDSDVDMAVNSGVDMGPMDPAPESGDPVVGTGDPYPDPDPETERESSDEKGG
ncbi:hypothetical protein LTR53_015458 [Teratosphaeriaceae sp. CCFEE 6253]|nr:hypothetical protein LTR53_015458 [Teratosphaeriaceae sp. CCFEE 6253]